MGDPWHLKRDEYRKAGVIVGSSNYTLYGDMSARVMRVLFDFTPDLEVYSIDEAFLNLAGFEDRLEPHARQLRATVLQWTGIPVSVGIAPTKTLAKVANRTAKKDPASGEVCLLLTEQAQEAALARLDLTDLWGVAGRLAARMEALGSLHPYSSVTPTRALSASGSTSSQNAWCWSCKGRRASHSSTIGRTTRRSPRPALLAAP